MASLDTAEPQAVFRDDAGTLAVALAGSWSADRAPRVEALIAEIGERIAKGASSRLDLSAVTRLDTMGAYVLNRLKLQREAEGRPSTSSATGPNMRSCSPR
jgi:phospholipid/cholesterol/gamma-HCH transport system permease protein